MLACNCLNVIIETETNDFEKVNADSLNLTEDEKQDNFFKQDIQKVGTLINITKTHPGLIQTRNVDSWIINYCINCDVHTHALHCDKGASFVLVYSKLLSKDVILGLRSSLLFSKTYNIIVDPNETDGDEIFRSPYLPSEIENTIRGLKQTAADVISRESMAVEERIKRYTEQQYNELDKLRDRAFIEQEALTRIILNNYANSSKSPKSTNRGMSNPTGIPSRLNEPLAAGSENLNPSVTINQRYAPKRQKSSPGAQVNSFDSEGLFEFDGMDDEIKGMDDSDIDESDIDEMNKEEVVRIPRSQSDNIKLAKSLPMNIPTFLSQERNRLNEDIDDLPHEETIDIAASIKALTKSVHGDAIFGDLPRPRFSTHV